MTGSYWFHFVKDYTDTATDKRFKIHEDCGGSQPAPALLDGSPGPAVEEP